MKGVRSTGMTAIVAALLIGCTPALSPAPSPALPPSASPEVSPDLSAGTPGLVTGQLLYGATGGDFQEGVEVAGGLLERVRVRTASSEMSDARLSGTVTVTDNADRFSRGHRHIPWGRPVGDDRHRERPGHVDGAADRHVGSLSRRPRRHLYRTGRRGCLRRALRDPLRTGGGEPPNFEWDWNGVIFSGNLPPDR